MLLVGMLFWTGATFAYSSVVGFTRRMAALKGIVAAAGNYESAGFADFSRTVFGDFLATLRSRRDGCNSQQ